MSRNASYKDCEIYGWRIMRIFYLVLRRGSYENIVNIILQNLYLYLSPFLFLCGGIWRFENFAYFYAKIFFILNIGKNIKSLLCLTTRYFILGFENLSHFFFILSHSHSILLSWIEQKIEKSKDIDPILCMVWKSLISLDLLIYRHPFHRIMTI